jgi:hypothetical protein
MERELFATTPTTMNQERFQFGNPQGLSIADSLRLLHARLDDQDSINSRADARLKEQLDFNEQLGKRLKHLASEVTELKPYFNDALTIRSAILDKTTGTGESNINRNAVVHGGNVIADLKAIDRMSTHQSQSTALRWRRSFMTLYGVPYTGADAYLLEAPRQVIESLNLRMDINSLHMWCKPRTQCANVTETEIKSIVDKRAALREACTAVIDPWYKSILDEEPIADASPEMEAAFQRIESIRKECFAIFHLAKYRPDSPA